MREYKLSNDLYKIMLQPDLNVKKAPKTATNRHRGYLNTGRSHESQDSNNNNSI